LTSNTASYLRKIGIEMNFDAIPSPIIIQGDSVRAFRDPAAFYQAGVFHVFHTLVEREPDGRCYLYLAVIRSRDLVDWSPPEILTPRNLRLNYSSPGNIVRIDDEWVLCLQTYPTDGFRHTGDDTARLFTMRSNDLLSWSEPELLRVKGEDVPVASMGRMIDPYLLRDKDQTNRWWCFYKQDGVSISYSDDDLQTWTYFGRADSGENACVLIEGDHYILFHSPAHGIGIKRSTDLVHWEDHGLLMLGVEKWPWAQGRLTAGQVLDLHDVPDIKRHVMFFHGSSLEAVQIQETHGNASLGIAWSDDLVNWRWPCSF
jgi:hypothetical protein